MLSPRTEADYHKIWYLLPVTISTKVGLMGIVFHLMVSLQWCWQSNGDMVVQRFPGRGGQAHKGACSSPSVRVVGWVRLECLLWFGWVLKCPDVKGIVQVSLFFCFVFCKLDTQFTSNRWNLNWIIVSSYWSVGMNMGPISKIDNWCRKIQLTVDSTIIPR